MSNTEQSTPPVLKKRHLLTAEFFTGLFCIGALVILFYFTVMIRGKELFFQKDKTTITAQFPNAGTLAVNDKIKVIGVEMGVVKKIELSPDYSSILITMQLNHKIMLRKNYEVMIQNQSVFGGAYVNITPGTPDQETIDLESVVLTGKPPIDIIGEASTLVASLKEDEQRLRKAFLEDNVFGDLKSMIKNVEINSKNLAELTDGVLQGKGTIGKMFQDEDLYNNAKATFAQLNAAITDMNKIMGNLQKGQGTLGKLYQDDQVYVALVDSMKSVRELTGKLSKGEGSLGKIMNDNGELYASMDTALKNLETISNGVKDGKGTIGKLMSDPALYDDLQKTVRQVRAAVEDFREMAPVATFGSIALGAL